MTEVAPPSKLLWAMELPRAAWAVMSLLGARRDAGDRAEGRRPAGADPARPVQFGPVELRDAALSERARLSRRALGAWAAISARGRSAPEGEKLLARIEAIHAETGERVTLVGVSLGGIMARFAAHRVPDLVREVITVSSPFAGSPRATNVWRAFELLTARTHRQRSA